MTRRSQVLAAIAPAIAPAMAGIAMHVGSVAAEPVSLAAFAALDRPQPDHVVRYGAAASQGIDVFVPSQGGPHAVAILVHGGCWSATTAGREQLRPIAAELARRGIAVWSIGYRRANEAGGGYPGTYQDVAAAIDRLRDEAPRFGFDLSRTALVGHSAGGHLALWAAARARLPSESPLRVERPVVPSLVVGVAAIGDLEAFMPSIPTLCGPDVAERLTGKATPARPDPYADTSPAALPPPAARVVMFSGALDRLVPLEVARVHARAMRAKGGNVAVSEIDGAGHFDFVTPGTVAWHAVRHKVECALGSPAASTCGGASVAAGPEPRS